MLTIHDPEKALASLPSPLLAADTLYLSREPDLQTVKLTAGLHRQTWVNGALIFIDVHISNNTPKAIKKIEVQLEKTTLWYTHPPVGTSERTVHYLRLPRRTDTEIVSGTTVKKSSTWGGIGSYSSDVRTVELEAPRGHVTISTGRYFEIRYFVNVVVSVKMFKTVAVQLPVTIIPINSLDILPNSMAQVAASIEAKRAKTVPIVTDNQPPTSFQQGQAFSAPVRQSLEKARQSRAKLQYRDVDSLTQDLDSSPRQGGLTQEPWMRILFLLSPALHHARTAISHVTQAAITAIYFMRKTNHRNQTVLGYQDSKYRLQALASLNPSSRYRQTRLLER
ncbi:uncharacterized protein A1O9_06560 [Exophiala aquamarina CBS 119918]|uniref:Arrestin C-terminal-like domain-containing protein n=1 Tax=Exophiala aquamarina CBS 119918 TaxID=1182545 RepID=A0A072PET1_9EURO|nr:uncharacterized protein A1O9_06560 [Exophiala aquamarina CBS 119918]KEF58634.1 hypothetical protein A1O9_06560 [Exophiala aquamarina CBS 119918]